MRSNLIDNESSVVLYFVQVLGALNSMTRRFRLKLQYLWPKIPLFGVFLSHLLKLSKKLTVFYLLLHFSYYHCSDHWLRWGEDLTSLLTSLFLWVLRWESSLFSMWGMRWGPSFFYWGWGEKLFLSFPQFSMKTFLKFKAFNKKFWSFLRRFQITATYLPKRLSATKIFFWKVQILENINA